MVVLIYFVLWISWIAIDIRGINARENNYRDLFCLIDIIPQDLRIKDPNFIRLNTIR